LAVHSPGVWRGQLTACGEYQINALCADERSSFADISHSRWTASHHNATTPEAFKLTEFGISAIDKIRICGTTRSDSARR
jgi:hypothetical protein